MASTLTPEELSVASGGLPRRTPANPANPANRATTIRPMKMDFFPAGFGRDREGKWRSPWEIGEELWSCIERWVVQFVADQGSAR